jgi:hypothetical protein
VMVILRTSDTHIVASAAISLASSGDRGEVVKTTKYGIDDAREKVKEVGSVIYNPNSVCLKPSRPVRRDPYCTPDRHWSFSFERHLQPRVRRRG